MHCINCGVNWLYLGFYYFACGYKLPYQGTLLADFELYWRMNTPNVNSIGLCLLKNCLWEVAYYSITENVFGNSKSSNLSLDPIFRAIQETRVLLFCSYILWHSYLLVMCLLFQLSCFSSFGQKLFSCLLLLSHFSCVQLCATPWAAAHQAPPSLGFSRQEHWSGLPFPSPVHESEKWK